MKRRHFLLSGTASAALALTGCGGGGSDGASSAAASTSSASASAPTLSQRSLRIAAAASGLGYPFGARLQAYAAGTKPTQSNAAMDAVLTQQYDAWKTARIVSANSVVAGGYADQFSNTAYMCVSEGMGYAMLLAVLFAGHDANAQQLFDGLLSVVRTRYAYAMVPFDPSGKYLMDWRLNADGTSAGTGWNAMDGDLDIAMSLLMADKQWGSTGTWNYKQEAINTIGAIKHFNMAPDGTTKGLANAGVSRTSDYMIGHFRAFQAATGDSFWNTAIDRAYYLSDLMQTSFSASAGLMPDFIVNTNTASPIPSPGYMGDGNANENKYWWNACRNPWRYATDYVQSTDARWKTVTGRIVNFFQSQVNAAGGSIYAIGTGYNLDGSQATGGNDAAYMAPIMLGGCIDKSYQPLVDALWSWNTSNLTTGYYDSEIQLLSMVAASGNWWTPAGAAATASSSSSTSSQSTPAQQTTTTTQQTTTAAVAAANILVNGNFANGLTGWSNWGNSQVVAGALQVGTAAGGVAQDIASKLTPGTTYHLTASANISAVAEGVFIGVKLMDANGNLLVNQVQQVSSMNSTPVSLTFTAPAGAVSGYVYVWKNANVAYGIVGNVSLAPTGAAAAAAGGPAAVNNLLTNGNFGSGLTGWNNWGNSQSTGSSVQVGTAAGGLAQDIASKLTPGTNYKVTGTANITASAEGVFIGVKLMDAGGNLLVNQVQQVSSLSPTGVSLPFTMPAGVASGYVYIWKNTSAAMGVVSNLVLATA